MEEGELSTGRLILGRFRLERELGHGGMGTVWAATHTLTGKSIALKFLKASSAGDETARRRFLREARSACAVRHPHVVSVHDVIELDDGAPVMVMDLLEGESLRARLDRERTIPLESLRPIVLQVLSALEALHAQGIVHRDLKPDNVFLCRGEGVKLLDFGIAKHVALDDGAAGETGALTGTGAMLGTPFYMAPEQAFGEKDIDARVDLWAMGIVLYECLTGVRPTQASNLGQILKIITFAPLPSIAIRAPELPASIVRIIDRCLSRERGERPRDVREVREVFESEPQVKSAVPGRRVAWVALVGVLALGAAGSAWLVHEPRDRERPAMVAVPPPTLTSGIALAVPPPSAPAVSVSSPSAASAVASVTPPPVFKPIVRTAPSSPKRDDTPGRVVSTPPF